jgi:nicotinamide-nucleotide amidase
MIDFYIMQHRKSKIFLINPSSSFYIISQVVEVNMQIGFLIIASEVLDGKITDSNTKLLADFLKPYHLDIQRAMVARDEKKSIQDALQSLLQTCDLVVTSGGLGPTKDDLTKETIAQFLGRKISYSELAHQVSEINYKKFDRIFPGKDHGYCFLPEGFIPLNNATGFAPGFFTTHQDKFLFCAPGVPRELKSMLDEHLIKLIAPKLKKDIVLGSVIIRTKKVPEEKIFGEVDPTLWEKLEAFGEVSSLPVLMGVDIGVKIKARNQDELAEKVTQIIKIIDHSPVKPHIWHFGPESLEEKIVIIANQKKIKFGFAESATGGLCSSRITNISGSSQCFMGSIVCYDERIKQHLLGVSPTTLKEDSAVSIKCAEEMAKGLQKNFSLDIAISITGFAGPGGGNDQFPVGSVVIGKSLINGETSAEPFYFKGDREILKLRFSQAALHALLEELEKFA